MHATPEVESSMMNRRTATRRSGDQPKGTEWGFRSLGIVGVTLLWLASAGGCQLQESAEPEGSPQVGEDTNENEPQPVAVVDETEAYLGILEPNDKVEKRFLIRNEGKDRLFCNEGALPAPVP